MLLGAIADDLAGATDLALMQYYSTFDSTGEGASARWPRPFANGPASAGASLDEAQSAIEELEETAKRFLLRKDQQTRTLTPEQVKALRDLYPQQ